MTHGFAVTVHGDASDSDAYIEQMWAAARAASPVPLEVIRVTITERKDP